jgi:hypothetical protein
MQKRMNVAGVVASLLLPFGGLIVARDSPPSWANIFSTDARASERIIAPSDVCSWNDVGWRDLSEAEKKDWETLGWSWEMWDSEAPSTPPPSSSKAWGELSENERAAARRLGYKHNTWDADNCENR